MGSNHDSRPDPDQLLEQIRGEEERARGGRLRIYFGASAGVGKTYAMLSAAQREHKAGVDVVVGVLETHGRDETAELLAGLQQLPLREVPYRDRVAEGVRPRRRAGTQAAGPAGGRTGALQRRRVRAIRSAGRT